MAKEVSSMNDFACLEPGQVIVWNGREVLFVGNRLVKTCNCCVSNCVEFPHVIQAEGVSGKIELVEIRSLEKPKPQKVTSVAIIHSIGDNHPEYQTFRDLLVAAKMITS